MTYASPRPSRPHLEAPSLAGSTPPSTSQARCVQAAQVKARMYSLVLDLDLMSDTSDPARLLVPTLPSEPSGRSWHNQVVGSLIHALPSWSSQPLVPILAVIMDGPGRIVLDPNILISQLIGMARTGHRHAGE